MKRSKNPWSGCETSEAFALSVGRMENGSVLVATESSGVEMALSHLIKWTFLRIFGQRLVQDFQSNAEDPKVIATSTPSGAGRYLWRSKYFARFALFPSSTLNFSQCFPFLAFFFFLFFHSFFFLLYFSDFFFFDSRFSLSHFSITPSFSLSLLSFFNFFVSRFSFSPSFSLSLLLSFHSFLLHFFLFPFHFLFLFFHSFLPRFSFSPSFTLSIFYHSFLLTFFFSFLLTFSFFLSILFCHAFLFLLPLHFLFFIILFCHTFFSFPFTFSFIFFFILFFHAFLFLIPFHFLF